MGILSFIFLTFVFIFSVIVHEIAHGTVANFLGDPTPKLAGRLTLNPLRHLDPIGSVLLPGFLLLLNLISGGGIILGWAKPVPINPYNFRDRKYGRLKVALAGPLSNFLMALVFGIPLRFFPTGGSVFFTNLNLYFSNIVGVNLMLFVFNLWPGVPFDGYHILTTFSPFFFEKYKLFFFQNPPSSFFGAILFMILVGFPFICEPLFSMITGFQI